MPDDWSPPPYRIRISHRAKSVHLRICLHQGLEVVIPKGFSRKHIPELLYKRRQWLDESLGRASRKRALLETRYGGLCPEQIKLQATGHHWLVNYQNSPEQTPAVKTVGANLLQVRYQDKETDSPLLLQSWLKKEARKHLVPWLRQTAREIDLSYQRTMVRAQKTLWASCSSSGTISINSRLMFLPAELVAYVFVHELCHTKHMNHSPAFWRLVEEKMPGFETHEGSLKQAWKYIPLWAGE